MKNPLLRPVLVLVIALALLLPASPLWAQSEPATQYTVGDCARVDKQLLRAEIEALVLATLADASEPWDVDGLVSRKWAELNVDATTAQLAPVAVAGALTVTPGTFYFLGTSAAGNADSAAASAAVLQAAATWTNGAIGDFAFFAISDNNSSAIYHYLEAGGAGITAAELTLMGTVDAKIVSGDLTFA